MLVKVLVEVVEVRACKASCQKATRRRSCWWRWRRSVHARLRVIYAPTAFRILLGEANCDAGAGAEGIENVTSTGNFELIEVLAYQLEMETRFTPVN